MSLASEVIARRFHLIAPQTTELHHERDLPAEMDDGVTLLADRWVAAARVDEPQPTVLVRSPYGRRQFVGLLFGRLLAERGFQVVVQSVRGTFGSGGQFEPFDERADGAATLRWLRAQPWHRGRVATFGPSYLGLVQWALAADAGDDLAAMAIQVSASQFHEQTYAGGSVALETIAEWLVILAVQERRLAPLHINLALRRLGDLVAEHPLVELDELATGAPVAWLREGFEHPGRDDDYWTRRDFTRTVPAVRAPVSFVGGWYDILVPWMLDDVVALQESTSEHPPPRLLIGPWTHTSPQLAAAGHREGIAFLRAHLLGDDTLLAREDRELPVRLWITGSDGGWRDFPAWPPEAEETRMYLRAGARLDAAPPPVGGDEGVGGGGSNDGRPGDGGQGESRAGDPGLERYRYDPMDPTPALGGPVLMSRHPVLDNAPLEARTDVLTFTSEPLDAPLEAIGRPVAELWVRGSAPWFDVFARLCEVDRDGVSRNVCDALASVTPQRHPAAGDGAARVRFELWPLGHRFAAGHRIRLQVSSGAHPRYARNPGTGADPASAGLGEMRAVDVEILRDADHPSAITLPTTARAGDGPSGDGGGEAGASRS